MYVYIITVLLIIFALYYKYHNGRFRLKYNTGMYNDHLNNVSQYAASRCRMPVTNQEKYYLTEYQNCSYKMRGPDYLNGNLGNYTQCTNNNWDAPNNLPTGTLTGRVAEVTKPSQRIAHSCYEQEYTEKV